MLQEVAMEEDMAAVAWEVAWVATLVVWEAAAWETPITLPSK